MKTIHSRTVIDWWPNQMKHSAPASENTVIIRTGTVYKSDTVATAAAAAAAAAAAEAAALDSCVQTELLVLVAVPRRGQ